MREENQMLTNDDNKFLDNNDNVAVEEFFRIFDKYWTDPKSQATGLKNIIKDMEKTINGGGPIDGDVFKNSPFWKKVKQEITRRQFELSKIL